MRRNVESKKEFNTENPTPKLSPKLNLLYTMFGTIANKIDSLVNLTIMYDLMHCLRYLYFCFQTVSSGDSRDDEDYSGKGWDDEDSEEGSSGTGQHFLFSLIVLILQI